MEKHKKFKRTVCYTIKMKSRRLSPKMASRLFQFLGRVVPKFGLTLRKSRASISALSADEAFPVFMFSLITNIIISNHSCARYTSSFCFLLRISNIDIGNTLFLCIFHVLPCVAVFVLDAEHHQIRSVHHGSFPGLVSIFELLKCTIFALLLS